MKRKKIKPISEKRKAQIVKEKELSLLLYEKQKGLCGCGCGKRLLDDWLPPSKHEIRKRSQGGDPTDIKNCVLLRGECHIKAHLTKSDGRVSV